MTEVRPLKSYWGAGWRVLVLFLASSSLGCLLADFYRICTMRFFTAAVFIPAMMALAALAAFDSQRGDGKLWRSVWIGVAAGLAAAVAYDIFRLPFVFAREWGVSSFLPSLQLFKVFPRFGAMILGQPIEQPAYSTATVGIGWAYHFSNGLGIGVMYMALIGDAQRRPWTWAVLLAAGLELGMLLTPYPRVFAIQLTPGFVLVTLAAHAVFGVCLGLGSKALAR